MKRRSRTFGNALGAVALLLLLVPGGPQRAAAAGPAEQPSAVGLTPLVKPASEPDDNELVVGDTDGSVAVYKYDGSGYSLLWATSLGDDMIGDLQIGDVDNDALNELVITQYHLATGPGAVIFFRQSGPQEWIEFTRVSFTGLTWSADIADYDGDGDQEVTVAEGWVQGTNNIWLLEYDPASVSFTQSLLYDSSGTVVKSISGDLNDNSLPEIFVSRVAMNTLGVLEWDPLQGDYVYTAEVSMTNFVADDMDVSDLNSDGIPELVACGNGNVLEVIAYDFASGSYQSVWSSPDLGSYVQWCGAGDFNDNGLMEFVGGTSAAAPHHVFEWDGAGWSFSQLWSGGQNAATLMNYGFAGDADNDGVDEYGVEESDLNLYEDWTGFEYQNTFSFPGQALGEVGDLDNIGFVQGVAISGPTAGLVSVSYPFIAAVSPITATQPITYAWQATAQDPVTHTGGLSDTITVTWDMPGMKAITVTAANLGGTATDTHVITVYIPVEADFTGWPTSGVAPLEVAFDNSSSGDCTESLWTFGDGVTSTLDSPAHTYTVADVYTVSLTASGPGGTNTLTRNSYITACAPVQADFTAWPTEGVAPLDVGFNNMSSGDYDACTWFFGDGSTSGDCSGPSHLYTSPGLYTATLTVRGCGGSDTMARTDYVHVHEVYGVYLPVIVRRSPTSGWHIETVDSIGYVGVLSSLALDTAGHPHISYRDESTQDLKYAYHDGTTWIIGTVDSAGDMGFWNSLDLDSSDQPHIAYINAIPYADDLKYAHYVGAGGNCGPANHWQCYLVDTAGFVGGYTSLKVGTSDLPHVSYYDAGNTALKYARYVGSGGNCGPGNDWQCDIVDNTAQMGEATSLALDSADRPHITYYQHDTADLRYAYHDGTMWQLQTVDSAGNVGGNSSLVLDASDRPHISYYNYTDRDLKYAYHDGTSWHVQILDSVGDVGVHSSLALDSANRPHIAYYDATNGDLKYAWHDGTLWHFEVVDSAGIVGGGVSLDLDAAGRAHISYYDISNEDLKYARRNTALLLIADSLSVEVDEGQTATNTGTVSDPDGDSWP